MLAPPERVLMLTPDLGFLDRRIAQEAASLARQGATVDIYPTYARLAPPVPETDGVRMISPAQPRAAEATTTPSTSLASRTKRQLIRWAPWLRRVMDNARWARADQASRLIGDHAEGLRTFGPYDVVFAHDLPVLPLGAHVAREWGATLVCDLHEILPEADEIAATSMRRRYWRRIETRYLPAADGILCVNDAVVEYVRERIDLRAPVAVVSNAVPFVATASGRPGAIHAVYGLPPGTRVMVFGGTLRPGSNLAETIDGFGQACLDGWVLALIGSGQLEEQLAEQVRSSGLERRVFLGRRVPQEDLIDVLASADVGLVPYMPASRNLQIATPNKLYEYIQARLPIAASRLPMIERVISANANGAFVDFSSAASAARDLRRFVEADLPSITTVALEQAARQVSWEHDEGALHGLVGDAIATRTTRAAERRA